jgi:hypothetical protein
MYIKVYMARAFIMSFLYMHITYFDQMWHVYTMEFYSATEKNEIMSFAGKWMELEIILSEISQSHKDK